MHGPFEKLFFNFCFSKDCLTIFMLGTAVPCLAWSCLSDSVKNFVCVRLVFENFGPPLLHSSILVTYLPNFKQGMNYLEMMDRFVGKKGLGEKDSSK